MSEAATRAQQVSSVRAAPVTQRACSCQSTSNSGCARCGPGLLQRSPTNAGEHSDRATRSIHDVIQSAGQPLSDSVRNYMEPRLGHDLSNVRVHTAPKATLSAKAVAAHAYTVGQHVVFGASEYRPETTPGRELLAHELVHTIQQQDVSRVARSELAIGPTNDRFEQEARSISHDVVGNGAVATSGSRVAKVSVQRLGDESAVPADLSCTVASTSPANVFATIQFPQGDATLTDAKKTQVQNVMTAWEATDGSPLIQVDGYASEEGADPLNWRLSCSRAEAVVGELMAHTSGPPGIPQTSIESFAHGETEEFSTTAHPPNRVVTISTTAPLPAPVCTHPGVSRTVAVQPVFFRTDPTDTAPTGGSFSNRLNVANAIWGKVGVTFNDSSPEMIDSALKTTGASAAEVHAVRALRSAGGVEVFMVDNPMAFAGGGATAFSGTAAAQVILSDGGTSSTLLAHELGHVLGIQHPGTGTPQDGEAGTIMKGSGSRDVENSRRNTMTNFRKIVFPAGSGSTCLTPDP